MKALPRAGRGPVRRLIAWCLGRVKSRVGRLAGQSISPGRVISASAFSSQYVMRISRYIVAAGEVLAGLLVRSRRSRYMAKR